MGTQLVSGRDSIYMIQEVACLWHPSFHGLRRSVWRRPCFLVLARLPYQVMSFNGNSWEASDGWQVPGFNGRTKWPKNKVCPLGFPKITILIECHEKNKCLYIHIYMIQPPLVPPHPPPKGGIRHTYAAMYRYNYMFVLIYVCMPVCLSVCLSVGM